MKQEKEIVYSCSCCGSCNVGRPFNNPEIELKCFECGHSRNSSHKRWMEITMASKVDFWGDKREF